MARQAAALIAGLLAAGYLVPWAVAEPRKDPAHALAQEFANGGEAKAARERKAEDAKRRAAEKASEAARKAAKAKRKAEQARQAAERLKTDEAEMLERARAEANERLVEQQRVRGEIERAERERAEAETRAAEAARKEDESRAARAQEQVKEAEGRRAAAERQAQEAEERRHVEERKAEEARVAAEEAVRREDERRGQAERSLREAEERAAQAERMFKDAEVKAAEAERLAKDAEERRIAEERRAEAAAAEAERLAKDAEERRISEERRAETSVTEAARLAKDAEERQIAEERRIETALAEGERLVKAAEERRLAEERRAETAAAETAREVEDQRLQKENRQIQIDHDKKSYRLSREMHEALDLHGSRQGLGGPERSSPNSWGRESFGDKDDEKADANLDGPRLVTILLIMDAGKRGIRRFGRKTADPMVCVGNDRCYISEGPGLPAKELSRRKAFGAGVALGTRAGACRNSLTCVFRAVDLGDASTLLQPIDLRILRHDRRETRLITADRTCVLPGGLLSCAGPVVGKDYRAWIVPERVARRAGPDELKAALEDGLGERDRRRDGHP